MGLSWFITGKSGFQNLLTSMGLYGIFNLALPVEKPWVFLDSCNTNATEVKTLSGVAVILRGPEIIA